MEIMTWVIGTGILWVLKLVTIPFAKLLAGDRVKQVTPPAPAPESEALPVDPDAPQAAVPAAPAKTESVIPTGYYILADVLVLGVAGILLGAITGWYFIGFSLKPRDWPGMIVFIVSSLVGSFIHG